VIGRHFSAALLSQVSGSSRETLDDALAVLCAAELVQPGAGDDYRFWHPLTQEVAYSSLLGQRRMGLHGAVARALAADADRRPELAALAAFHFERAGQPVEAARWHEREGTRVWPRVIGDALDRWRAALALLSTAPETEESCPVALRIHAQMLRVGARVGLPPDHVEQHLRAARYLAARLGDETAAISAEYAFGVCQFIRGEFGPAIVSASEVNRFAEATEDFGLRTAALQFLALLRTYAGPVADGLRHVDDLIAAVGGDPEVGARKFGFSPLVRGLLYRSELLCLAGHLDEARADGEAALKLARARSDVEDEIVAGRVLARRLEHTGEPVEDLAWARQAVRVGEDSGNTLALVVALRTLGVSERLTGELQASDGTLRRALRLARDSGVAGFDEAGILADLAGVQWQLGSIQAAAVAANEAVEVALSQGGQILECRARLVRGRIWRAAGRAADATAELHAALGLVHETGAVTYEPFIREELARLQPDEKALIEALRLYRQIGATGHTRRLEAELGAEV
jgi:tetratricopeptide (TPR) repeat protein